MDSAPYPFSCHVEAVPESLSCREGPAQSLLEDTRTKVMGWRPLGAYMPLTFLDDGQSLIFKNTHLWELVVTHLGQKELFRPSSDSQDLAVDISLRQQQPSPSASPAPALPGLESQAGYKETTVPPRERAIDRASC